MLIVPNTQEKVSLVVPTVRRVVEGDEGEAVLVVYDSTSHEVYDGTVTVTDIRPFALTIPDIIFGLPLGQYVYYVWEVDADEDSIPLSTGILQCGLTAPETQAHNYQPEVIRYER